MEGKNTAMLAYIPFVGFLIAYFINAEDKNEFATWHIKNMFGLFLLFFSALVIQAQVHSLSGDLLWGLTFGFWIFSFIMAAKFKKTGIPYLSSRFQEWFQFLS